VSDARDLLRRYLEQRRDMGETEFALDGLEIEAALALIANAKGGAAAGAVSPTAGGSPRDTPVAGARDADWRAALAGSGLAPASPLGKGKAAPDAPSADESPARPAAESPAPTPLPPVVPREGDRRFAFAAPADPAPPAAEGGDRANPGDATAAPAADGELDGLVVGQAGGTALDADIAGARSIDDIAHLVAACAKCGLGATKHRDVVGEGDPNADFVVVGEAPGEQEDLSGRPFVGASGQLLTKILAAINLPREQVYICNVIKHRPPGNRNPTPAEVAACSPFLLRQLELVKPKVILAVGTFAAQTLLRTKEPIGKLRGRVHRYYGVPLVVTYHPAALLRNPSWKRPTWDDVQLARRILDRASRA
jgi:DNA polymerase